jgi:hypothetical protein
MSEIKNSFALHAQTEVLDKFLSLLKEKHLDENEIKIFSDYKDETHDLIIAFDNYNSVKEYVAKFEKIAKSKKIDHDQRQEVKIINAEN